MVYIIGWLGMFLVSLLVHNKFGKFFGFTLLIYLCFITVFRGLVGTDTISYISMFESIAESINVGFGEVGFLALSTLLLLMTSDPVTAVNLVSLVFFILIGVFYYRANENESFLLFAYLLPVFAYSYSMNALRIGLAFAVFILIFQNVRINGSSVRRFVYFFIPVIFHFSAIAYPMVIYLHLKKWLSVRFIAFIVILVLLLFLVFYLNSGYFLHKLAIYEEFSPPHPLSGLRIVLPLFIIILGASLGRLPTRNKIRIFFISSLLIAFAFLIVQFSYAGLRILDLLSAAIPLSVLCLYERQGLKFDKNIRLFILLAGVLSAIGIYRGFLTETGVGDSPFLPYHFVF